VANESSETEREIYKIRSLAEQKYIYFLLAASGAGILFALNQTKGAILELSQLPLAIGIFCWGLSFIFGCNHLNYLSGTMYLNLELLKVQRGQHPDIGTNPIKIAAGDEVLRELIEGDSNKAQLFAKLQLRALMSWALLYICWHILELYRRTI